MKITVKDIQRSANPIELFKSGCKTEATFREYEIMLKKFVNEFLEELLSSNGYEARVNELVSRAKEEPDWIKQILNATLAELKKRTELEQSNPDYIKPRTIHNYRNSIKKLLDMNEIALPWKSIDSQIPQDLKADSSRGWTRAEIKKMLSHSDASDSCIILIASSSGIRLGGFDFTWNDIRPVYLYNGKYYFESYEVTESVEKDGKIVCGIISIYGNAKESYYAFITIEAYNAVLEYRQYWIQKSAREPKDTDPFVIKKFSQRNAKFKQLSESGIRMRIERVATEAGLRNQLTKGQKRHEVPLMNGFRRYFNKSIKESNSKDSTLAELIKKERMMGHETGLIILDANYFKTHVSELIEEYLQVVPNLTISDEKRQKARLEEQEKKITELSKKDNEIQELKQEMEGFVKRVIEKNFRIVTLEEKQEKFKDYISEEMRKLLNEHGFNFKPGSKITNVKFESNQK